MKYVSYMKYVISKHSLKAVEAGNVQLSTTASGWLTNKPAVAIYLKNVANALDNVHFIRKKKH